ncbi:MAG: NAD-dependent epimerase/dehydratase family protein [Chlamydiae bacterium]|nr:NAD-dependent epimerase/dehydratase family protein [Chlamydiota bacterium]
MKVLVTGANGFIGKRIIPSLLKQGHDLCLFLRIGEVDIPPLYKSKVQFVHGDLLDPSSIHFPEDIDAAFYLVHSMTEKNKDFYELEEKTALNFLDALKRTKAKQIIYLSGLITDKELSKHLSSRLNVENILKNSSFHFTGFRAGVIIGAGSASFEMIRDLVEKLPFMIAPRWVLNKVQPIASTDVVYYMTHALGLESTYGKTFDIGSEDILTFKEMLETYAKVRHLKRKIFVIPFFYPHLSVWWLNLVTSVNYHLAKALVQSLKNNAICSENSIKSIIERNCLSYEKSLNRAFNKILLHVTKINV